MGDLQPTQHAATGDVIDIREVTHRSAAHDRFGTGSVPDRGPGAEELGAPRIAVLIPCHNEEATVGKVVRDFRRALPSATIYVYDNASTDGTREAALDAGAIWRHVPHLGKGNVLRRMFAEVEAQAYVLADGDDTYDATAAPEMVRELWNRHLDMVVGVRIEAEDACDAYRRGHRLGNKLLTRLVHWLFRDGSRDMLSGYRVFSRRYVKSFPAHSRGFETETEMTVHALDLRLPFSEMPTEYRERRPQSMSKLKTVPDGIRILRFIVMLLLDYRPFMFFGALAAICTLLSLFAALLAHGDLHAWTPQTFVAATSLALGMIFAFAGVILDSLGRSRKEVKRILYLAVPSAATEREIVGSPLMPLAEI
jgi:glycosyltransferase involved in cell wall biosynthesis